MAVFYTWYIKYKKKKKRFIHIPRKMTSGHNRPHLGRDTQGRVESIGSSLALLSVGGAGGVVASGHGVGGGLALGLQLAADEARNDLDVEGTAVVEVGRVSGGKGLLLAAVETCGELDGRVGARAEVEAGLAELTQLLAAGGGVTLVLLSTTVGDAEVTLARVGGVGAGVVLDGTAALEGGALVHEAGTVHREGALGIASVSDCRGSSSEVASECLDVVLAAGTAPGTALK
jgi:hypothetical protein